ncbi:MAG TPA: Asp-tRNA(Asn)/Glu-tRNA(Gln) amidotransferase subunit GatC [Candidatus Limivivens merdigallinarum]|uniref:Aspartyl/glutamyl-tRNA(Asn/Gln) amidotransferase subunit C n=1 Tax=Candidatus Limivivens merdigallinarum TaxID=2840859 RepID=A0A9D0ZTC7_9FIRM|nr:Asp-tRNA(Asn)/Glu-tRNA(Gln) amidotransferase subunit GatC [Candidatus Limivivens merdigallinarum]
MAEQLDRETMENVALLSKLMLSEEEMEKAKEEMQRMLDYVDKLNTLDTEGVDPVTHLLADGNVFREDVVENGDESGQMLENAPEKKDGQFKVPRTVE